MERYVLAAASGVLLWAIGLAAGGCAPDLTVIVVVADGGGGSGGVGGSGSSATGGSPGSCKVAADCGEPVCGTPSCNAGKCEWTDPLPLGSMPMELGNVKGDCKEIRCNGMGQSEEVEELKDKYSYGAENSCYDADCEAGMKRPTPVVGKGCPDILKGKCDSKGHCSECVSDMHCGVNKCQEGKCVPVHCFDLDLQASTESDLDCGKECSPCSEGKQCSGPSDCASEFCNNFCVAASCDDFKLNGDETDVDCGATCNDPKKLCATGKNCLIHADCVSKNCQSGQCQ